VQKSIGKQTKIPMKIAKFLKIVKNLLHLGGRKRKKTELPQKRGNILIK